MRLVCRVNEQTMDSDEQTTRTLHKVFGFGSEISTEIIDSGENRPTVLLNILTFTNEL